MKRVSYSFLVALATLLIIEGIHYLLGYKYFHISMLITAGVIALFVPSVYKKMLGQFGLIDVLLCSVCMFLIGSIAIKIFPPTNTRDMWDYILPYYNLGKIVITFFILSIIGKFLKK
jgi:uncharacterized protein YjeT (DUF2065 family)